MSRMFTDFLAECLHGRPERKVNAMSKYLTWDCPKCGESLSQCLH